MRFSPRKRTNKGIYSVFGREYLKDIAIENEMAQKWHSFADDTQILMCYNSIVNNSQLSSAAGPSALAVFLLLRKIARKTPCPTLRPRALHAAAPNGYKIHVFPVENTYSSQSLHVFRKMIKKGAGLRLCAFFNYKEVIPMPLPSEHTQSNDLPQNPKPPVS